jgi:site-specific recombinase XerD
MNFTDYLQQKKCSPATTGSYEKYLGYFTVWLAKENLVAQSLTYTELLDFIRYLTGIGKSKGSIHKQLGVVRHYFNYLIAENKRIDNPAAGLFIKGLIRKLPLGLLGIEEMQELYNQYTLQLHVDASKKIMLGLMIYQGITVGELMRIQAEHIKMSDGKIVIKGTRRTNERVLNLHAHQMLPLKQYLDKNKFKDGPLFIEPVKKEISERNVNNRIQYMFGQLRTLNKKVINAKQLRSSVITQWLKQYNLRQVQYMAGHKYVSSTERYQLNNIDDLKNAVQDHHPMK